MRFFSALCYIFAVIAVVTGGNDIVLGVEAQRSLGSTLTGPCFADPLLDNVFRFLSGLWMGIGLLFVLFVRDIDRYKPAMIALLGIVILGGFGRVLSLLDTGLPGNFFGAMLVCGGLAVELGIVPIMLWWLLLRHRPQGGQDSI